MGQSFIVELDESEARKAMLKVHAEEAEEVYPVEDREWG
jgi:hypothetical protein